MLKFQYNRNRNNDNQNSVPVSAHLVSFREQVSSTLLRKCQKHL